VPESLEEDRKDHWQDQFLKFVYQFLEERLGDSDKTETQLCGLVNSCINSLKIDLQVGDNSSEREDEDSMVSDEGSESAKRSSEEEVKGI
jgi:hypothetical protein